MRNSGLLKNLSHWEFLVFCFSFSVLLVRFENVKSLQISQLKFCKKWAIVWNLTIVFCGCGQIIYSCHLNNSAIHMRSSLSAGFHTHSQTLYIECNMFCICFRYCVIIFQSSRFMYCISLHFFWELVVCYNCQNMDGLWAHIVGLFIWDRCFKFLQRAIYKYQVWKWSCETESNAGTSTICSLRLILRTCATYLRLHFGSVCS